MPPCSPFVPSALTGGLFLLVFALLRGSEEGWGSAVIVGSLTGAAVLLAAILVVEARVREPMLPLRLFRDGAFSAAQVAAFGLSGSLFAMWLYIAVGVAALGALVPADAAFRDGAAQAYVDGFHDALWTGAALAATAAVVTAALMRGRRAAVAGEMALERA